MDEGPELRVGKWESTYDLLQLRRSSVGGIKTLSTLRTGKNRKTEKNRLMIM